ncbi:transcription factor ATF2 [Moelleriella libera RCEF 2490]|uniref:Transcription factor ATF2 n=1 Tax=Moelleriella libera RCEF 2490 TaxID=1081109 RepID=A0A162IG15_9HYPO|nr:transcription factor ATF2 [Moelleriella libera RCEF 2490]
MSAPDALFEESSWLDAAITSGLFMLGPENESLIDSAQEALPWFPQEVEPLPIGAKPMPCFVDRRDGVVWQDSKYFPPGPSSVYGFSYPTSNTADSAEFSEMINWPVPPQSDEAGSLSSHGSTACCSAPVQEKFKQSANEARSAGSDARTPHLPGSALERNRQAATKFRKRNKETVQKLEHTKDELERDNYRLKSDFAKLSEDVVKLKTDLMQHSQCRDGEIDTWIRTEAKKYTQKLIHDEERIACPEAIPNCTPTTLATSRNHLACHLFGSFLDDRHDPPIVPSTFYQ